MTAVLDPPATLDYPEAELVFALVGAVGTDLARFQQGLADLLKLHGYEANPVRMSDLIRKVRSEADRTFPSEFDRINTLMTEGTELRKHTQRGDAVAMLAVRQIFDKRELWTPKDLPNQVDAEQDVPGAIGENPAKNEKERIRFAFVPPRKPLPRRAHILNSLKHPEEVNLLRGVYGSGFFLIGVYVPELERHKHLVNRLRMSDKEADLLMDRDHHEGHDLGQRLSDVFHRADVFVRFRAEENANRHLERFLDLVFGDPFQTPTAAEHAMFLAFANSLRSASLSRQVGAVLVSVTGELVGFGANDVPSYGGGLYWPERDDRRDHVLEYDSNDKLKDEMLFSVMSSVSSWLDDAVLKNPLGSLEPDVLLAKAADLLVGTGLDEANAVPPPDGTGPERNGTTRQEALLALMKKISAWLDEDVLKNPVKPLGRKDLIAKADKLFAATGINDITEFGRAVHAEMEALLSAARSGVSPRGGTLYCTTFPCHNCAKHLVASGVVRVVYVEPYAKSRAEDLHADAIELGCDERGKVHFEPFVGIGPRRYFDLFSMRLGSGYDVARKHDGLKLRWSRGTSGEEEAIGESANRKRGPRVPMLPTSYIHREDHVASDFELAYKAGEIRKKEEGTCKGS